MILLLGGTGAGRRIAAALAARGLAATVSLAGATRHPAPHALAVRTGGFGGAEGLAAWLAANRTRAIIDATHPFAARISANALAAAHVTGIPIIRADRPPWAPDPGRGWTDAADAGAALAALPTGARALLTIGRGGLSAIGRRRDVWTALRVIDPPDRPYPGPGRFLVARPPFDRAAEAETLQALNATHLVTKNAGGAAGRPKLEAAWELGLGIVMVRRPEEPQIAPLMAEDQIPDWAAEYAAPGFS